MGAGFVEIGAYFDLIAV